MDVVGVLIEQQLVCFAIHPSSSSASSSSSCCHHDEEVLEGFWRSEWLVRGMTR
jgi:hypothetical protein